MSSTDWLAKLVDARSTRDAYASHVPSRCDCCYCRNFFAAMPGLFGTEVTAFLLDLGIDPEKPSEVIHYARTASGHLYEVIYHVFGTRPPGQSEPRLELRPGIQLVCSAAPFPHDPVFDESPHLRIQLLCERVNWVIEHEEPAFADNG